MRYVYLCVLLLAVSDARATQQTPAAPHGQTIQVELSQKSEPHSPLESWVGLADKVGWPLVALLAILLFRNPLGTFLREVGRRANEISIGGFGIKFPTLAEAPLGDDVLAFKASGASFLLNDSAKTTLFQMFRDGEQHESVVVNLGSGAEWLTSRLFIFAIMLQRMKGLRCIVFTAAGAASPSGNEFVGISTPDRIRWALAQVQPWLEQTYARAYSGAIEHLATPVYGRTGALDPSVAELIVRNFVQNLTQPTLPAPGNADWVRLGTQSEHTAWIDSSFLTVKLRSALWLDSIVNSPDAKAKALALLKKSAPFVAIVDDRKEFQSVVDRVAFLDEFANRMADKMPTK